MDRATQKEFLITPDRVSIWKLFRGDYDDPKEFINELFRLSEEDYYMTMRCLLHCNNGRGYITIEPQDGMCNGEEACERMKKVIAECKKNDPKLGREITMRLVRVLQKVDEIALNKKKSRSDEWDRRFLRATL